MATSKHRQAPVERDLCSLSEFELLHKFTDLICKQHSLRAKALACEIMRRYSASRLEQPDPTNGHRSILGNARWGDAKRVYEIYGLKRGPLDRIRKAGLIKSRSLDEGPEEDGFSAVRAKRLYDLISIEEFLRSPEGGHFAHANVASSTNKQIKSNERKKPNL